MRTLGLIFGFLMSMSVEAALPFTPYIGVEVNQRMMNFKEGFGRSQFEHSIIGGNGVAGGRLGDFALEVGGHITPWSSKANHEHKITGIFANVLGFYPIKENVEIFGGLGMSHLTFSFVKPYSSSEIDPPKYSEVSTNIADNVLKITKESFKQFSPKAMLGVQYKIVDNIFVRSGATFEVTRKLKHCEVRPKNSTLLHTGLVLSF